MPFNTGRAQSLCGVGKSNKGIRIVLNIFSISNTTRDVLDKSRSAAGVSWAEGMARSAREAIADSGLFLPDRNSDEGNTLTGEQDGDDFGVSQR